MPATAEPSATASLERFVVPAMTALQNLNPKDRPATREKLAKWFERSSYCSAREDIPMHLFVPEVMRIIGAGPISTALATLAGESVEGEAPSSQVVSESALRCVSRLKRQTDFLTWSLDRRCMWMKQEGYAKFTIEPQMLAAELERLDAVKAGAQKLTYNEDVLKSSAERDLGKSSALPKPTAAMCKTFSVPNLAPGLQSCMTKGELKGFMAWLKILGCRLRPTDEPSTFQVTVMAGSARHSTSVPAAQELERQVVKELPEVLMYLFGNPDKCGCRINPKMEASYAMKGFVIGKDGEPIRKLESQYHARLTYKTYGRFVGWLSTSLLPVDGTAESLRGLGTRLKQYALKAEAAVNLHISHVLQKCERQDAIYKQEKAEKHKRAQAQMKAMASSPLQEAGQYGAAQLDRDHARQTDALKKAQRKEALAARQNRQGTWKKRRDHMEQQHGGRRKAGEGRVGREDRADAGQGSGAAEDLRPQWEDPVGAFTAGFRSQLDKPSLKVPGSKPRHRGHKPGDLRADFDPNERQGLGADSPAAEADA